MSFSIHSVIMLTLIFLFFFFFFNDTATTEIYTLSLHDALPISGACAGRRWGRPRQARPRSPGDRLDSATRSSVPDERRRSPPGEHRGSALPNRVWPLAVAGRQARRVAPRGAVVWSSGTPGRSRAHRSATSR